MEMSDSALQKLETKIAFLERHVEEQDRVILKLRKTLDALELEMEQIKANLQESGGSEPANERPPHY